MTEDIGAALRAVRDIPDEDQVEFFVDRVERDLRPFVRREAAFEIMNHKRLYYSWTQMSGVTAVVAVYALALAFIGAILAVMFVVVPRTAAPGTGPLSVLALAVICVTVLAVTALFPIYYMGRGQ